MYNKKVQSDQCWQHKFQRKKKKTLALSPSCLLFQYPRRTCRLSLSFSTATTIFHKAFGRVYGVEVTSEGRLSGVFLGSRVAVEKKKKKRFTESLTQRHTRVQNVPLHLLKWRGLQRQARCLLRSSIAFSCGSNGVILGTDLAAVLSVCLPTRLSGVFYGAVFSK